MRKKTYPDPGFSPCPKCSGEIDEIISFTQYKPAESIIKCKCGFSLKLKGQRLTKLCKEWNAQVDKK